MMKTKLKDRDLTQALEALAEAIVSGFNDGQVLALLDDRSCNWAVGRLHNDDGSNLYWCQVERLGALRATAPSLSGAIRLALNQGPTPEVGVATPLESIGEVE